MVPFLVKVCELIFSFLFPFLFSVLFSFLFKKADQINFLKLTIVAV